MAQEILVSINVNSGAAVAGIDKTSKSVDKLANSNRKLVKSQKQVKTNAGLNNAIIAESARLASDASFGYTAMANNLGQLVSLLSASRNAAGGLAAAFSALLSPQSLFLIGIQLLITFGGRIYDFFIGTSEAAEKAAESIRNVTESIDEAIGKAKELAGVGETRDPFSFLELDEDVIKKVQRLNREFSDFTNGYEKLDESQKKNRTSLDLLVADYFKYQEAQRTLIQLSESLRQATTIDPETGQSLDPSVGRGLARTKEIERRRRLFIDQYDLVSELEKQFQKEEKKGNDASASRIKILRDIAFRTYEQRLSDFDRFAEKARTKELNFIKRVGVEKIEFEKQQAIRELDLEATQKVEQEKIRYEGYLSDIELRKQTLTDRINEKEKELILEAETEDEKQRIRDNAELRRSQVQAEYLRARTDANDKYGQSLEFIATSFANATNSITESYGGIQDEFVEQQELTDLSQFGQLAIDGIQQRIQAEMNLSRSVFDRIDLEKELEKSRHEEKMAQLKDELRQAKINGESTLAVQQKITNEEENYSNTKKEIARKERDAKVSLINDVADVFLMAAKEGSDVAKAVAIFAATVNTYEAITAALGAKPYTPLNIAQALAVGAKGFLQVREIARTPKPLGGGGGGAVAQAPSFNVVGASGTNQILNAVRTALDPANQPPLQVLPVAFEGDMFDGINDGNRNMGDPDGFRSLGG